MKGGYTLIEILVAIGIFTMIIASPVGFLVGSLKGQQRALSTQLLLDNVSYSLEYISRALRMAKKDDVGGVDCLLANKVNYEITHGGQGIKFRNYNDECQEFYLDNGKIMAVSSETSALTPIDLEVVAFRIGPQDSWDQTDNLQPKVTLFMEVRGIKSSDPKLQPKIQIQTTVTQRNLDVQY
ncbi:MAG: type II secretion system protein [bacterium]